MIKKGEGATTISIGLSVYAQLKTMKIIDDESFNSVIKRILLENRTLKEEKCDELKP